MATEELAEAIAATEQAIKRQEDKGGPASWGMGWQLIGLQKTAELDAALSRIDRLERTLREHGIEE